MNTTKPVTVRILIILAVVGVSFSAIFVRLASASSITLAMLRLGITVILLLPLMLTKYRAELFSVKARTLGACALSGVALGLHFATYFEAIKNTSLASGLMLVNTETFFIAIMLFVLYHEKIPVWGLVGVITAFAGGVIIAGGDFLGGAAFNGKNMMYGDLMAILSAVCMSVYTLIGRKQRQTLSALVYCFLVYLAAALTLAVALIFSPASTRLSALTLTDIGCAAGMAVFCTLLGHTVFNWGIKFISALFISTAKMLEPVFSCILGFFLFAETPALTQLLGGVVVTAGIYVYTRSTSAKPLKSPGK